MIPISLTIIKPNILQDLELYAKLLTLCTSRRVGLRKNTKVKKPRLLGFKLVTLQIPAVGYEHPTPLS